MKTAFVDSTGRHTAPPASSDMLKAVSVVWRDNEGPFENLFRLISYSPVLFAGFGGLLVTLIDKFASWFGYGLEDFGAYIDKKLGKGPKSDVSAQDVPALNNLFTGLLEAKAASQNGQMVKVAGLGSIFKLFGGTGKLVNLIISLVLRAFAFVAMALGAASTGDIYNKVKGAVKEQIKEVGQEAVQEMFQGQMGDLGNVGDITDLLGYVGKNRS